MPRSNLAFPNLFSQGGDSCPLCRRLVAERDELSERVRQLESIINDRSWVPDDWGLTPSEITVLNVLALRRLATKEAIHFALYGADPDGGASDKIVDVLVCKMRPKLARVGITVHTAWGAGYRLDDAARVFVTQLWKAAA